MMKEINGIISIIALIVLIINGDIRFGIVAIWSLMMYLNWEKL